MARHDHPPVKFADGLISIDACRRDRAQGSLHGTGPAWARTPRQGPPLKSFTGDTPMRVYTLYGPPKHVDRLVQGTEAEAEASHEVFEGATTE